MSECGPLARQVAEAHSAFDLHNTSSTTMVNELSPIIELEFQVLIFLTSVALDLLVILKKNGIKIKPNIKTIKIINKKININKLFLDQNSNYNNNF